MLVLSLKLCLPVLISTSTLVSGHANMIDCTGDKGGLVAGLGFKKNAPLEGGNDLNAVEQDAVKFNNGTTQFTDCGVTNAINNEIAAIRVDPTSSEQVSAALSNAGSSQLPQVSSLLTATWLTMVTDGGGFNNKVRALLDVTGTGKNFDESKPLNVQGNVNGNNLCNVLVDGTPAKPGASITATSVATAAAATATPGTAGAKGKGNKNTKGVRKFVGSLVGRGSEGGKMLGKRAAIILNNGAPNQFKLNIAVPPGTKCTGPGNTCVMRVDNKVDGNECANFFGGCIVFQMAGDSTATKSKAPQTNANAGSKGAATKANGKGKGKSKPRAAQQ